MKMKIISWNINGIRSNILDFNTSKYKNQRNIIQESPLGLIIKNHNPDIICYQETRLDKDNYHLFESEQIKKIFKYQYWNSSQGEKARSGNRYSGTSVWSKIKPEKVIYNIENINDKEGRYIELHFKNFILLTGYIPNAGSNWDYRLNIWEPFIKKHIKELCKYEIPVIYTGDLNIANGKQDIYFGKLLENKLINETDEKKIKALKYKIKSKEPLHNMRTKVKLCGYTKEERNAFNNLLNDNKYIDCFRYLYPDVFNKFSWFNIRIKNSFQYNLGWRIDMFLIQEKFKNIIKNCDILYEIGVRNKYNNLISDHLPILLEINL